MKQQSAEKLRWHRAGSITREVTSATETGCRESASVVDVPPTTARGCGGGSSAPAFPLQMPQIRVSPRTMHTPLGTVGVLGADFLLLYGAVAFLWQQHRIAFAPRSAPGHSLHSWARSLCPAAVPVEVCRVLRGVPFLSGVLRLPGGRTREVCVMIDTGSRRSVVLPRLWADLACERGGQQQQQQGDGGAVSLCGSHGHAQDAAAVLPLTLVLKRDPAVPPSQEDPTSAVVLEGVAFHAADLASLRRHQARVACPVVLLGVECLHRRGTFAFSAPHRAVWL